jgi:hypothetical protein
MACPAAREEQEALMAALEPEIVAEDRLAVGEAPADWIHPDNLRYRLTSTLHPVGRVAKFGQVRPEFAAEM